MKNNLDYSLLIFSVILEVNLQVTNDKLSLLLKMSIQIDVAFYFNILCAAPDCFHTAVWFSQHMQIPGAF